MRDEENVEELCDAIVVVGFSEAATSQDLLQPAVQSGPQIFRVIYGRFQQDLLRLNRHLVGRERGEGEFGLPLVREDFQSLLLHLHLAFEDGGRGCG